LAIGVRRRSAQDCTWRWSKASRAAVWASMAWSDEGGLEEVTGIEAKLDLALHHEVTTFFLPDTPRTQQIVAAWQLRQGAAAASMNVTGLPSAHSHPLSAMARYRQLLQAEPVADDPPQVRVRYYLDQISGGRLRTLAARLRYYCQVLLEGEESIATHCRRQIKQRWVVMPFQILQGRKPYKRIVCHFSQNGN
jgi:hypothetical protein